MSEIDLNIIQVRADAMLSNKTLVQYLGKIDSVIEQTVDALIITLKKDVLSEKLDEQKHTWQYWKFDSWWEHFKDTYFPLWLQKYFPIRGHWQHHTVIFEHRAMYPSLDIPSGQNVFKCVEMHESRENKSLKHGAVGDIVTLEGVTGRETAYSYVGTTKDIKLFDGD